MNTIIERIRAEVNRLKGQLIRGACAAQIEMETSCKDEAYNEMLSILSALEKEEKPIGGLEEEIREFVEQEWDGLHDNDGNPLYTADYLEYIARHFAKWQKEQMMDEWLKDRDGCFWDGVEEGKKAMEKEAVEGYVDKDFIVTEGPSYFFRSVNLDLPNGFKEGDKVRIIICKKDD